MTEIEKNMTILEKEMITVVNIQKGCQKAQARTTENVDKLVTAVNQLSHDTVYLQSLVRRINTVEATLGWFKKTLVLFGLSAAGSAFWFFMKLPK